jgi:RimJ/RimL family protein N-acetyltransferase
MVMNRYNKFLEGSQVYLRPLNGEDAELYYQLFDGAETRRLTGTQRHFTKEQIVRYIDNKSQDSSGVLLLIALHSSDELVGEVALTDIDRVNRNANIRIAIDHPEHQGKGYGQEALLLMLDYGFGVLNLHRIDLEVFAFNPRAIHVYEKLGFVREGVRRDALFYDHQYHDAIIMSMLEEEYRDKYLRK